MGYREVFEAIGKLDCTRLLRLLFLVALATSGCRLDMHDQPRYESFEKSDFFADGAGSRIPPEGTVAQGLERNDELLYTGKVDGVDSDVFPFRVTRDVLARGRNRFDVFCSPCHDRVGTGQGMIVQRGMQRPPSLHGVRLKEAPPGYIFNIITNGYGAMFSYASRIRPEDRWAIVAYLRALQLSQSASYGDVPDEDIQQVEASR